MKAISLWQPWASLVAAGVKTYETRSWVPSLSIKGQRIAICSAKTTKGFPLASARLEVLIFRSYRCCLSTLPLGTVVATAVVAGWERTESVRARIATELDEIAGGDYSDGRWAWKLTDVRPVRDTVPVRGAQGIFNLPADALAHLVALGVV